MKYRRAAVARLLAGLDVVLTSDDSNAMSPPIAVALAATREFAGGGDMQYDRDATRTASRLDDRAYYSCPDDPCIENAAERRMVIARAVMKIASFAASEWTASCGVPWDDGMQHVLWCGGTALLAKIARAIGSRVHEGYYLRNDDFLATVMADVDGVS